MAIKGMVCDSKLATARTDVSMLSRAPPFAFFQLLLVNG